MNQARQTSARHTDYIHSYLAKFWLLIRSSIFLSVAILSMYYPVHSNAVAGQVNTLVSVSATVIPNAKLQTTYETSQLSISSADINRGYIDIPSALRFTVLTNSRNGYRLDFNAKGFVFESVQVIGISNLVRLGPDGGSIVLREMSNRHIIHDLSFRFILRSDIKPGLYQWPLEFSVHAIS